MTFRSEQTVPRTRFQRALWIGMIFLCVIAAAAVIRRLIALANPPHGGPAELVNLDALFASKPYLTVLHLIPALLFVFLVPFQLSRSFRNRHLRLHRWMGRTAMVLGVIIATSAVLLLQRPVGGAIEISAILVFDSIFVFSLIKAFLHIRRREIALHREWVIRAVSVALGVATVRPIMGVFFATSPRTGLTVHQFFGTAFWMGFILTYVVGEVWIRYTRSSAASQFPGSTSEQTPEALVQGSTIGK